jgi:hypothetical protein
VRVSGFTILRDGVKFRYPFVESICSLLDLVDEFIVNVGDGEDGTLEAVQGIGSPKIRILRSTWEPRLFHGGYILAHQTNLALAQCGGDWCFYLQGDEVVHENDLERIENTMRRYQGSRRIEGLTFRYQHFRGSYEIRDPLSYRRQVRVIRNGVGIESVKDACGFACHRRRLRTRSSGASIYHYGWVRSPQVMARKTQQFNQFYHGPTSAGTGSAVEEDAWSVWKYELCRCVPFRGTHPQVMQERIRTCDWELPKFRPIPWWRNLAWWGYLLHRNTRFLRRLVGRSA